MTLPTPPVPQSRVTWGSPGHCSVAGGILSLHIPRAVSCLAPTHAKGCCWPPLPQPLVPALPWLPPLHWHRAVGSQPRELLQVENNSVFPEQSDTGSLCQAGSQSKASMPVLARGKRHHYFWQGRLLSVFARNPQKVVSPCIVTASTGDAFLPQQGCEQP